MLELNHVYNMDCMLGMREIPDKYFELAIVDPPYGIDVANMNMGAGISSRTPNINNRQWVSKNWDTAPPTPDYFDALFRIAKNQIIWGGNYFDLKSGHPFCVWAKGAGIYGRSYSECEQAWINSGKIRFLELSPVQHGRIHPTQKPVALYKWLLTNYAKPGDKILDTHVGSGSSIIACIDMGFEYMGFEIDADYYKAMQERIYHFTRQQTLEGVS